MSFLNKKIITGLVILALIVAILIIMLITNQENDTQQIEGDREPVKIQTEEEEVESLALSKDFRYIQHSFESKLYEKELVVNFELPENISIRSTTKEIDKHFTSDLGYSRIVSVGSLIDNKGFIASVSLVKNLDLNNNRDCSVVLIKNKEYCFLDNRLPNILINEDGNEIMQGFQVYNSLFYRKAKLSGGEYLIEFICDYDEFQKDLALETCKKIIESFEINEIN